MRKWETDLAGCYRNIASICKRLGISSDEAAKLDSIAEKYPVCIPEYYLGLIDPGDPEDPIRKMAVPSAIEFSEGGAKDTSGEADNTVIPGMQHKYGNTVLILSTNQCAMYCRHCFRKRLVGLSSEEVAEELPLMAEYIGNHPEIDNALISGGDSFLNPTSVIRQYLGTFTSIDTIRFIRFGTRVPVTFPQRITEDDGELLALLAEYRRYKEIIVVTQFNHPKEITEESTAAINALRETGCIIRNQTVLLKGVNDDPETLSALMNGLVRIGVMPYYIFQCRPVEGVKNQFQIPIRKGAAIIDEAKRTMSGPAKSFRYAMSHHTGKIEIIGESEDRMLYKYHQAKYPEDNARIFSRPLSDECWFLNP